MLRNVSPDVTGNRFFCRANGQKLRATEAVFFSCIPPVFPLGQNSIPIDGLFHRLAPPITGSCEFTRSRKQPSLNSRINAATAEVDDLLSKRTLQAAKKQVVIFSTSWCPACQAARRYMDSKGISYRDVDVEKSSEGANEYRRQGGDGSVPLIVVGDRKMVGFSSAELDSML